MPKSLRRDPAQLQHQVPGKVLEGTEGSGSDIEGAKVWKVLLEKLGEVPEGSSGEVVQRSGAEVPIGSCAKGHGAESSVQISR